ncbi:MAG: uracil-DNA glycosylase family protein [Pseudomonadota bacterium]
MSARAAEALRARISQCTQCADQLPHGPRPIVQFSPASRVLIIGQAPGAKVHASGVPWDDDSGDRLRGWLGLDKPTFYNPDCLALVPMGLCYPGKASGGDAPPRPECAALWHDPILAQLRAIRLTLLVGVYAQRHYLPHTRGWTMTERVRRHSAQSGESAPTLSLPHPAWRSRLWMARNPWFEAETLPHLRAQLAAALDGRSGPSAGAPGGAQGAVGDTADTVQRTKSLLPIARPPRPKKTSLPAP